MITFTLDESKNLIVIKMSGDISSEEAGRNLNEFVNTCRKLQDGFVIIDDISELDIDSESKLVALDKVHVKMLEMFNVRKVIRIVGKAKSVLVQLSKIDREFNLRNIYYVPTLKEAIDLVDQDQPFA